MFTSYVYSCLPRKWPQPPPNYVLRVSYLGNPSRNQWLHAKIIIDPPRDAENRLKAAAIIDFLTLHNNVGAVYFIDCLTLEEYVYTFTRNHSEASYKLYVVSGGLEKDD